MRTPGGGFPTYSRITSKGGRSHGRQGPWIIRLILRVLHRHTGYVAWDDVDRIDWDGRVVHLCTNELGDLTAVAMNESANPD